MPGARERRFEGLTATFDHNYFDYISYDTYAYFPREDASSSEAFDEKVPIKDMGLGYLTGYISD